MPFEPYVKSIGEIDHIYTSTTSCVAWQLDGAGYPNFRWWTATPRMNSQFGHFQPRDTGVWYTYLGWQIKDTQNPSAKNIYLIFQYYINSVQTNKDNHGFIQDYCPLGLYRWCVAELNSDNTLTILNVCFTYSAGQTYLRVTNFDYRNQGGISNITYFNAVIYDTFGNKGLCVAVVPGGRIIAGNGNTYNDSSGWSSTWEAMPLSMVPSRYDARPTPVLDPNDQEGESEEGGGTGDHDDSSDPNPKPSLTGLNLYGAMNAGFVTLYKTNMSQLQAIANELNDPDVWQAVHAWLANYDDMVAGLMLLPFLVTTGASYYPKIGLFRFSTALPIVSQQYYEIDCGEILVSEYYGSCFDYSPYTSIDIFLPHIGTRSLDVDEIMGKYLGVTYHIDCMNGDCVAFVTTREAGSTAKNVKYQFSGSCGQQIAINRTDFSAVINQAISFATAAVAAIATSGAAGAAAGAAATEAGAAATEAGAVAEAAQAAATVKAATDLGASAISAVMNGKPRVERTGCMGGSIGHMSVLKPYIIKKVPRQSKPANYNKYNGYPSNIYGTVGSFSGFTVFEQVRLENIAATDPEIAEIQNILRGGVIL